MQKYRADTSQTQADGATLWFAQPFHVLSRVNNCRIDNTSLRRAVYITGDADTYFSIPAATRVHGKYIKGYVTRDDAGDIVFHAMDSHKARIPAQYWQGDNNGAAGE